MTVDATDKLLRLAAFDIEDLSVLSANLQDTQISVAEIAFLQKERRFVLAGRRYDWVKAATGGCERVASGLHFNSVRAVACTGFAQTETERVLNLLAISFEPGDPPGGSILLTFSGNAAIRLQVECIDAQMHDLGPRWPCRQHPAHAVESDA